MRNLLLLICLLAVCVAPSLAQKRPATPAPRPAPVPKGPPPYVLKKDYEPQIEELKGKINAASNAAASARNSVENKFQKVIMLDSQMQEVQAILSSASFQISMNADSLKETRFSMEEFQKKTETNFNAMHDEQEAFGQKVWILFGVSVALSIIMLVVLLTLLQKRMATIQSMLVKNEEILKKSLSLTSEKLQKELKDELQSSESRMLIDISSLKRELTLQFTKEKEATAIHIESLTTKIERLENPQTDGTGLDAEDPEIFI